MISKARTLFIASPIYIYISRCFEGSLPGWKVSQPPTSRHQKSAPELEASLELDVFRQPLEQLGVRSCTDVTFLMDEDLKQAQQKIGNTAWRHDTDIMLDCTSTHPKVLIAEHY